MTGTASWIDKQSKCKYRVRMADPYIWKHPEYMTYYAIWQDEENRTRREALGTKDGRIANRLFRNWKRNFYAGKIKPISSGLSQTFSRFVDEFLGHFDSQPDKEDSTYTLYEVALKKARECWGDIPLKKISERHLDNLLADMGSAGLAIPTINKNYRHVKAALRKAIRWGYMDPLREWPKPVKEKQRIRYLTLPELRRLMKEIDDPEFSDFCMLSAYTGLRSGEILRLTWDDINNPEGFIRIVSEQKNKDEDRIPINPNATAILDRCKACGNRPRLFRFKTVHWISQKFKKYAVEAGLADRRFHDLRHTYGSHSIMSGEVDIYTLQALMRHRSLESTKVYAKLAPEHLKRAGSKLSYGPMPVGERKKK